MDSLARRPPVGLNMSFFREERATMPDLTPAELERYKRITQQMTFFADRMRDSFKLFIQLTIAISGGLAWLKTQERIANAQQMMDVARWAVPFLAFFISIQIFLDQKRWQGYRKAEHELMPASPPPKQGMAPQEITMIVAMGIVGIIWPFIAR
jgi:hypothetical protein